MALNDMVIPRNKMLPFSDASTKRIMVQITFVQLVSYQVSPNDAFVVPQQKTPLHTRHSHHSPALHLGFVVCQRPHLWLPHTSHNFPPRPGF